MARISLSDLTKRAVAILHGEGAVAEIEGTGLSDESTSFQDDGETIEQRPMYVVRAGAKISAMEDGQRWDGARGRIQTALSKGELTAYTLTSSNQKRLISIDYWRDYIHASLTLHDGTFTYSPKPKLEGLPVYVKGKKAQKWLTALTPPSDKAGDPSPNKKRQAGEPKPSTVAGLKEAHDEINHFRNTSSSFKEAAKMAALNSNRTAGALIRARQRYIEYLETTKRQQ